MSILASIAGSGAGLIVIALAFVLNRHYRYLPKFAHDWVARLAILLMFAGGSTIAVTQLGSWIHLAAEWAARLLGGINAGLPHAALVIASLFMLAGLVVAFVFSPGGAPDVPQWMGGQSSGALAPSAVLAAVMPLILGLVAGGFLHQVYEAATGPAQAFASSLSSWIGG